MCPIFTCVSYVIYRKTTIQIIVRRVVPGYQIKFTCHFVCVVRVNDDSTRALLSRSGLWRPEGGV